MKFGFSENLLPNPESHRMKNLEVVIPLAVHKALMGTQIHLQIQLSGLRSGGTRINKPKPQFSNLTLTIGQYTVLSLRGIFQHRILFKAAFIIDEDYWRAKL